MLFSGIISKVIDKYWENRGLKILNSIISISHAAEYCQVLVAGGHHSINKSKQLVTVSTSVILCNASAVSSSHKDYQSYKFLTTKISQ